MQAIRYHRYGGPDALALEDVETPVAGDDQVLVRVRAASVNALDWHALRGLPYLVRATDGLRRPRDGGLGCDIAGVVESVGEAVTRFRPGDEVFGMTIRSFAELAAVREAGLVPKPANLSFEQAAAIPLAGSTALQGLRDKGRLREGSRVLVNGAGGGVGSFAVQIAKAFGAHVTAVTHPDAVDLARSAGADEVIDYTAADFTRQGIRYDLIFDTGGNRSFRDCARAMAPDGVLVICGAPKGNWLAPILRTDVRGAAVTGRQPDLRPVPGPPGDRGPGCAQGARGGRQAAAGDRADVRAGRGSGRDPPNRDRPRPGQARRDNVGLIQPAGERQLEAGADAVVPALRFQHDPPAMGDGEALRGIQPEAQAR